MRNYIKKSTFSNLAILGAITILSACGGAKKAPMLGMWINQDVDGILAEVKPSGDGYSLTFYEASRYGDKLETEEWPARYKDGVLVVEGPYTLAHDAEAETLTMNGKHTYIYDATGGSLPFMQKQIEACVKFTESITSQVPPRVVDTFSEEFRARRTKVTQLSKEFKANAPAKCKAPRFG